MVRGVVLREEIFSEVTLRVAPYSVDVVCVVLRAIVFDEETRPL